MVLLVIHVICDKREYEVYEFVSGVVNNDTVWFPFLFQFQVVVVVYSVFPDCPFCRLCEVCLEQGVGIAFDVRLLVHASAGSVPE